MGRPYTATPAVLRFAEQPGAGEKKPVQLPSGISELSRDHEVTGTARRKYEFGIAAIRLGISIGMTDIQYRISHQ